MQFMGSVAEGGDGRGEERKRGRPEQVREAAQLSALIPMMKTEASNAFSK